jgi:hypothetical protein
MVDRLKRLLREADQQRVAQRRMAPAANRNAAPWRHQIVVVISLIGAVGLSGCAAGGKPGAVDQAVSTGHQAGSRHHQAGAARPGVASHRAGGASRDPRQVAQEFAMFYAKLAANEDHPASPAQVEALARQLAPNCSPATYGQYRCVVHLPGRVPSIQHCVAVVASSGSVTGRCSVGTAPAPVVASGYVDCASVGRVVSLRDGSRDEKRPAPLVSSVRSAPAGDPHADLLEVRVAATPTRFCADFRTLAPLSRGSWLTLDVNHNGAPDLQFAPTVNYRSSPTPELQSPINTPVAGQIGTSRDWTSLVITAGNPSAPLPGHPFQFRAYANHETSGAGTVRLTVDSAPDTPRYATYP